MQFPGPGKPPVGVIFDSDLGNRIDSALAMALLYGFAGKGECRVVALSVSKPNLKAAAFCAAISRFYMGPGLDRSLPVGLSDSGASPEDTPMLTAVLSKPVYPHGIAKLTDTAEVTALIRNALTAQQDQNAIVVLAGPATNLAKVLGLPGAIDVIARKVKFLSMAGGATLADVPAAKKLFAEWPTPIIASGDEDAPLFPASSIEKDFAWTPDHPIVDAYRAYKPMPYDAPTWDMTPVLYAARPQEGYFKLSEPGTLGVTKFTPSADGKHRQLSIDPSQRDRIVKIYTEIASAKPVPRPPRPRP